MNNTIKPRVQVQLLEMEDPTFEAGSAKQARATLSNPTTKEFTYTVELYMGATKAATSGVGNVTVAAGSSSIVTFNIVMPLIEGSYDVYLDVHEAATGTLLAHFKATEQVITTVTPAVNVGPITWV